VLILITAVALYLIFSMAAAGEANSGREAERVKEVIDKALVQCYALEGSYPPGVDHLANYGVIIDRDRYFYDYDIFATNIKPSVVVVMK